MDYCHNNGKTGGNEFEANINKLGYAGIWPSNYDDVKVVPIGTPGVTLTDIYDKMVSNRGSQNEINKLTPIGDHSYPVPVPVPVITPRTRKVTREILQEDSKIRNQSKKMDPVNIKPKRRSMESINSKNIKTQGTTRRNIGSSDKIQPIRKSGGYGSLSSNDHLMRKQKTNTANRSLLTREEIGEGVHNKNMKSETALQPGTRLRKSSDMKNNSESIHTSKRIGSVNMSRKNSFDIDTSIHQVPEDYCPNLRLGQNVGCYPKTNEFPEVPYPFSMSEDNNGYLKCNYEPVLRSQSGNTKHAYDHYSSSKEYNLSDNHHYNHNIVNEREQRVPVRRVTQSETPVNTSSFNNFYSGRSGIPLNTNLNKPKEYSRYVNDYYNSDELSFNNNRSRSVARSASLGRQRPTLTNSISPFSNCIPNYESPNQLNPPTYNCYSVPKRYNNSIHDLYRDEDNYSDLGSCITPTKTLMYCSGQYQSLEADKYVKQNYSTADEVFRPKMYETIVYPPGYFEYKKKLEDIKRKYILEKNPNAFFAMKNNGNFLLENANNTSSSCLCNNYNGNNRERRKTNHIFVRTTNTSDHYNRMRPDPACYC